MPADPQYTALLAQVLADPGNAALQEQLHARYLALVRGGTTSGKLPYPSPTDPIAEGADAIRALAEKLDPPWIPLTFSSGSYYVPSAAFTAPAYRIIAGLAEFIGTYRGPVLGTSTVLPLTGAPAPRGTDNNAVIMLGVQNSGRSCAVNPRADGGIRVWATSAGGTGDDFVHLHGLRYPVALT